MAETKIKKLKPDDWLKEPEFKSIAKVVNKSGWQDKDWEEKISVTEMLNRLLKSSVVYKKSLGRRA